MKRNTHKQTVAFALSCPLLLTKKQRKDPYYVFEQFFSFTSLGGYRRELTRWFKCALNEGSHYKRASDLLFLHNQFLLLINAGFLITQKGLQYTPVPDPNGMRFCDWLVKSSYSKEKDCLGHQAYNTPYWLKIKHREAPLEYLQKNLTIDAIADIRKGLHDWQDAALSSHLSLEGMGLQHSFGLYELLQKIVEACYLVLIADVKLNKEQI